MKKEKSAKSAEFKAAVIKQVKSLIVPVVLCAIILVGVLVVINYKNPVEEKELVLVNAYEGSTDEMILESDNIKFAFDPTTTQFSVTVKDSGKVWYSNPQDAQNDTLALPAEKNRLNSTLLMSYATETGLETEYNTQGYSVGNGLYEIEQGDDYIRVDYTLGDIEREYIIPPICTEAVFNDWLSKMSKEDLNLCQQYYKKYNINKLGKKDNKEELLANYPILETEICYILRDTTKTNVRKKLEQVFADIGYTYEEYEKDKEMTQAERTSDKPIFGVSMIYRLDGDDLVVEIPLKDLDFKSDSPIYTITPLPYFGAGGKDDTGYMLVPEGGGGIINFNNGKVAQSGYYANMYGWDFALSRKFVVHNTRAYYNVFGVANEKDSFLCMMEEGVPYAGVQADIAGKIHNFNYVNAKYNICVREQYDVGDIASSDIFVYLDELPDETITQRYRFINSASYVDMAEVYHDYLTDKNDSYLTMNTDEQTPVAVEIVGAVDKVRQVCGVPVSRPLPLTTYEEAAKMIQDIKNDGIENLSVKLSGWCNGGVRQKILRRVNPISSLGSKKDLQNLSDTAKNLGVDLYLDGVTHYEFDSNLLHGFFSFTDAARKISKERAEQFIYSDVTYSARETFNSYYLLHADLIQTMMENLEGAANQYGTGVSFKDTGMDLSADYYKKNFVSRQQAMTNHAAQLKKMDDADMKIMINMGNDYALPYADVITNMDLRGSEYTILDENIPFYQLAVHGMVDYTGFPINAGGNDEQLVLYSAEYGAGLYFVMMKESAFSLQKTLYTEYYGSDYDAWRDRMMTIYNRYNAQLGHTFNQRMVGHDNITDELSCTIYEDGTKVYVNYSYDEVESEDGLIPARDYKVIR